MSVIDEMRAKLEAAFQPEALLIEDESEAHRGHAGYQDGGESHFNMTISAPVFGPMNRVQRHRAVHEALGKDIMNKIHALAIKIES